MVLVLGEATLDNRWDGTGAFLWHPIYAKANCGFLLDLSGIRYRLWIRETPNVF